MFAKAIITNPIPIPVAISDKALLGATSFTIQTYELCTMCGERFGIGFHGPCNASRDSAEIEELPKRLTDILAKDHRQNKAHKRYIDLDGL